MRINGSRGALILRSSVKLLALGLAVALLSACIGSAEVSQLAGVDTTADGETTGALTPEDQQIADDQQQENTAAGDTADIVAVNDETGAAVDGVGEGADDAAVINDDPSTLKIMAVGDSITQGNGGAKSYRKPLEDLLQLSGCNFEMVGSMTKNLPETGYDSPHEAFSGHRTDAFLTGQHSSFGHNQGISESMMQFMPQLVLLNLGTNDVNQKRDADDVIADIDQIVALIFDAEPQAQIVISTLLPYFQSIDPNDPVNIRLEQVSDALEAWFVQAAHPRVYLIDTREGFTPDMMQADLVHPGDTGDAFIADKFHRSIEDNNICG